jgi:LPS-assembly lipoprotein
MLTRRAGLAAVLVGITGCGFELRRAPELKFRTVQLKGFAARSPLAIELARVVASTASGEVRELQLRARLHFRLRSAAGKELIPSTEIVLSRDMSYNERDALAKEQEEALLYKAMQSDIVAQLMRRLAAVQAL